MMFPNQERFIGLIAPRGVEVALVLLSAWMLAGLLVGTNNTSTPQMLTSDVENNNTSTKALDVRMLKGVKLFGEVSAVKTHVQKPALTSPVVDSRLNIKLIGTVVAGKKSAAMVTTGGSSKQAIFFLKEEIQSGVFLEKVEATAIVVSNRGKRERISIEASKPIKQAVIARARPTYSAPVIPIANQVNRKINKSKLQSQMRNFSTLLSQARVSPHFSNKKPDGFTISEIAKGSLYEEIGLRNGDVIKKVNGESVTGAEQAMRMYRELQNATFIDVEVERAGTMQQFSYVIQ
ncbi:MAG: type II secretion system protein N [Ghiorsea sp.]